MDLSYFEEPVEVLVTEMVGHMDEATQQWVVDSPAVYETQQQTRKRPQSITQADILRVIGKGGRDAVVDAKLVLLDETNQWAWFDLYQAHLAHVEEVEAWNELNVGTDEEGVVTLPRELPVAPVRPPIISAVQWRENNFIILRQAAYGSWQSQMEMLYDDQKNGTTKFRDAIDSVKYKYSKPGAQV